jgi:hypothetical protein
MTRNPYRSRHPYGPRHHWTEETDADGRTTWRRFAWDAKDLAFHLADALPGGQHAVEEAAIFYDDHSTPAWLITDKRRREFRSAQAALAAHLAAPPTTGLHPETQGPGDIINTDAFEEAIALALAEALTNSGTPTTPEQARRDHSDVIIAGAVRIACAVELGQDDRGLTPVRALTGDSTPEEHHYHWVLAWPTPVRGLYIRDGDPTLFCPTYTVITGSGWALRAGFSSREIAAEYAVAIAEAVPRLDWRVLGPIADALPDLVSALRAEDEHWTQTGRTL